MGYTHYWYRPERIPKKIFREILRDTKFLVERLSEYGLPLANWDGKESPELTEEKISFNGVENCGHPKRELGITWPDRKEKSDYHEGSILFETLQNMCESTGMTVVGNPGSDIESEGYKKWFAGAVLTHRECGGDCSHESFVLPRIMKVEKWQKDEENWTKDKLVFCFTKTAYKPYDLAVTAVLIICKHYLPEMKVVSDGESEHWDDARLICEEWLGYGKDFELKNEGE